MARAIELILICKLNADRAKENIYLFYIFFLSLLYSSYVAPVHLAKNTAQFDGDLRSFFLLLMFYILYVHKCDDQIDFEEKMVEKERKKINESQKVRKTSNHRNSFTFLNISI